MAGEIASCIGGTLSFALLAGWYLSNGLNKPIQYHGEVFMDNLTDDARENCYRCPHKKFADERRYFSVLNIVVGTVFLGIACYLSIRGCSLLS